MWPLDQVGAADARMESEGQMIPHWKHQLEAITFCQAHPAAYLAMGMRTGKSRIVVDLCVNEGWRNTLILCPKSGIPVWGEMFHKFGTKYVDVLNLGKGTASARRDMAESQWGAKHPMAAVINYEGFIQPDFRAWALRQKWDAVVVDEAHHLKAPSGVASRQAAKLRAPRRLMLSGTPLTQDHLVDAYSQYRFLDPSIFGTSVARHRARYAVMNPWTPFPKIEGYRNQEEFQQKLGSIMFKVERSVLDLPPATHTTVPVELGPAAAKMYLEMERHLVAQVQGGVVTAANALVRLLRLSQITGGWIRPDGGLPERVDEAKLGALVDILEEADGPVVVYGRFTSDIADIHLAADRAGLSCSEISGSENRLIDWKAGKTEVLAVQIHAGAEAIDLTRANHAVYYSKGYSLSDYEQSLARTHGPDQKRPVSYTHLVAAGTVDEVIEKALAERKDVVRAVMEGLK